MRSPARVRAPCGEPPTRARPKWRRALLVISVALVSACDAAFHARRLAGTSAPQLSFAFGDGSHDSQAVQGDPVVLDVSVPRVGYSLMADLATQTVDPTRLVLLCDRPLGDPQSGGIDPGVNVTPFAIAQGFVQIVDGGGATFDVRFDMNSGAPLQFPTGLLRFTLFAVDDADRVSSPFLVELTLVSPERPTLVLRLERPPPGSVPTGLSLPLGSDGQPFVGEQLPFALIAQGIPNPSTGTAFTLLLGPNGIDPTRLQITADHDLGDPLNGGIAAGTNLAPLFATDIDFIVDPDTGGFTTGMLFPLDALFSPALGSTTFSGTVLDDADVASDPQTATLAVDPRVTLSLDVQPIFSGHCGFGCHDGDFPFLGQDLSTGHSYASTVNVRAVETPDDSCATLRVAPYDSDASYLFHKVSGTHLGGCVNGSGDQMPPGLPLGGDDLATIEGWILQGAPDD